MTCVHLRATCRASLETHLRASAHKIYICEPSASHLRTTFGPTLWFCNTNTVRNLIGCMWHDAVFYRFLLSWWDFSANDGDFGFIFKSLEREIFLFGAWVKILCIIILASPFMEWLFSISRLRWLPFKSKSLSQLVGPRLQSSIFCHTFLAVYSLNSRFQGINNSGLKYILTSSF